MLRLGEQLMTSCFTLEKKLLQVSYPSTPQGSGNNVKELGGGMDVSARRIGGRTMKGHSLNLIYVLQSLAHISYSYLPWADIRSLQGPTLYL